MQPLDWYHVAIFPNRLPQLKEFLGEKACGEDLHQQTSYASSSQYRSYNV